MLTDIELCLVSRRGVAAAPRLFHLRDTSAAQGRVKVEAYDSFSQVDITHV